MSHSFALADLLPPSNTSSHARVDLQPASLAVIGTGLPTSALFHLALSHLEQGRRGHQEVRSSLSEKAQGKQRALDDEEEPQDDVHSTLDLEPIDTSAAASSYWRHVLVMTPDIGSLRRELAAENDTSLFGRARDSARTALLQRITFKNLPTSAHFKYFLASLYDVTNSKAEELYTSYCRDTPRSSEDPSYLPFKPSMVILHSPSLYLAENTLADAGIEAYAAMLALFVSSFSSAENPLPMTVLVDPVASTSSLPLIPPRLAQSRKRPRHSSETAPRPDNGEQDVETLPLKIAVARFFDCVAETGPALNTAISSAGESKLGG
ncbi:hypothetical protein JCM3766R1_003002 [Sporobolomyces carnicolor]